MVEVVQLYTERQVLEIGVIDEIETKDIEEDGGELFAARVIDLYEPVGFFRKLLGGDESNN